MLRALGDGSEEPLASVPTILRRLPGAIFTCSEHSATAPWRGPAAVAHPESRVSLDQCDGEIARLEFHLSIRTAPAVKGVAHSCRR